LFSLWYYSLAWLCGRPQDLPSPAGSDSADAIETIVFIRMEKNRRVIMDKLPTKDLIEL
jgi:hypothetical protein